MSLTCLTCKLLFSVPALHQEHYKSEWHRYNCKRKIAELPSLTKEEFETKIAAFKEDTEKKKKVPLRCEKCNKQFSSENALGNHLQSKKHIEQLNKPDKHLDPMSKPDNSKKIDHVPAENASNIASSIDNEDEWSDVEDDDDDWESVDGGDNEMKRITIDTNDCLFCDHPSESTESNVLHMTKEHSFFIPDIEYVSDLDALIASLAAKIYLGHICLWCNGKGKSFRSVKSVRRHMFDKGHFKMLYEGDVVLDYADCYDYSTFEGGESKDMSAIEDILENPDFELVLPSGATIGHRSLAVYYKQNLKPVSSDSKQKVKKVLQQYKALGYTGTSGPMAVKVARDISYVQRIKQRYNLKLGLKQNKLQPHFRQQVLF
ncbi:zinc finger protein 622 [Trichonephila inaurata madagascariensis]|uniref:Zinc finger protein 622 n=1 Tax=Trichonephila inaurata madagascariensis TaxID=2747483 RepID=A0A8X6Y9B2_9ARAC|nr:zinc finger protein 622 [Trichonephila inaurata madagascariensis]